MEKEHTSIWKRIFNRENLKKLFKGGLWSASGVLVWEMIEEGLEELLALAIASGLAIFTIKLASTLGIVFLVQLAKLGVKKLVKILYPIIRQFTYKDGGDKVKLFKKLGEVLKKIGSVVKKYLTYAWGNKVTGTLAGAGFAGIAYFQTLVPFLTGNIFLAVAVFVVFFNIGVFFGGETLKQIYERTKEALLKKEEKQKLKEVEKKAKELAQLQKDELLAKAKQLVDAEHRK